MVVGIEERRQREISGAMGGKQGKRKIRLEKDEVTDYKRWRLVQSKVASRILELQ